MAYDFRRAGPVRSKSAGGLYRTDRQSGSGADGFVAGGIAGAGSRVSACRHAGTEENRERARFPVRVGRDLCGAWGIGRVSATGQPLRLSVFLAACELPIVAASDERLRVLWTRR